MQENAEEKILDSLNSITRANAPDFFYEKVRTRLMPGNDLAYKANSFFVHPVLSVFFIFFILALNFTLIRSDVNRGYDNSNSTDYSISTTKSPDDLIFNIGMDSDYMYISDADLLTQF